MDPDSKAKDVIAKLKGWDRLPNASVVEAYSGSARMNHQVAICVDWEEIGSGCNPQGKSTR